MSLFSKKVDFENKNDHIPCDVCYKGKQTRLPFPSSDSKAKGCFDLIYCDIWGAYSVESLCGAHYFVTIVDDASRGTWVYLMKYKSEASKLIVNFCVMVKTQLNLNIKVIRSENGKEFTSNSMKQFYWSVC